jgi:hypothetical protein
MRLTGKAIFAIAGCLCGAAALFAQQLPNPVTGADVVDITAQVVDSVSAAPIGRAEISLEPQNPAGPIRTGRTDSSGTFVFRHVSIGVYALTAAKTGYAQGVDSARDVILASGTQPSRYTLKLLPQAVVTGTVTGDDGEPLAAAYVVMLRPEIVRGHKRYRRRENATTDDRGIYRMAGLGPGECVIAAIAEATADEREDGLTYVPTFYPNAAAIEGATTLQVTPGSQSNANISLSLVDGHKVTGHAPVGANIELMPAADSTSPVVQQTHPTRSEAEGFTLDGVPAGNYILRAQSRTDQQHVRSGYQPITVGDDDLTGVTVAFDAPPSLSGKLHPVGDGDVSKALEFVGVDSAFGGASATVGADGSFQIAEVLPPYRYQLLAPPSTTWYVQSATQSGTDVMRGLVITGPGSPPVDVTVSPRGASITTSVQWPDSGPRVPARLTVLQQNGSEMRVVAEATVRPPNTWATDRVPVINGLAPGDYMIYAWAEPVTVEYGRADALGTYSELGQSISLQEGEQAHATVKVAGLP